MSRAYAAALARMARNNQWANHRLYRAVGQLSARDYFAQRTSFFPTIHLTLSHIYIVDVYYLDQIEENGRGQAAFVSETPFVDFAQLKAAQAAEDRRAIAICERLDDVRAERKIKLDRGDFFPEEKIGDVLLHLFEHQIHHRGQVHAMLAGTEVAPPQLDEFFLAQDAALRAGDLAEIARGG